MPKKDIKHISLSMAHSVRPIPEETENDRNYDALCASGYELACSAHERVKGDESTEAYIWRKDKSLFIGNSTEELVPFNGYVKNIFTEDTFRGTVAVDYDNPSYSESVVLSEIEAFLKTDKYELKDQHVS